MSSKRDATASCVTSERLQPAVYHHPETLELCRAPPQHGRLADGSNHRDARNSLKSAQMFAKVMRGLLGHRAIPYQLPHGRQQRDHAQHNTGSRHRMLGFTFEVHRVVEAGVTIPPQIHKVSHRVLRTGDVALDKAQSECRSLEASVMSTRLGNSDR